MDHEISGAINVGSNQTLGNTPKLPDPPSRSSFIVEVHSYADERGAKIEHRVIISGTAPSNYPAFIGHGAIRVETPEGVQQVPFPFPIDDVTTVEEAFGRFEVEIRKHAEAYKEKVMAQRHAPQILIPGVNTPHSLPPPPPKKA